VQRPVSEPALEGLGAGDHAELAAG
jgi:hypothetical protein